jgi:hypothetical protein
MQLPPLQDFMQLSPLKPQFWVQNAPLHVNTHVALGAQFCVQ